MDSLERSLSMLAVPLCPHCGRIDATFYLQKEILIDQKRSLCLWTCGRCNGGVCTETNHGKNVPQKLITDISSWFCKMYPGPEVFKSPEGTPEKIAKSYYAAKVNSLDPEEEGMWEAAAIMARKTVELAAKDLGAEGRNLKEKIEDLVRKGMLTPSMKEWVHEVRVIGNDGAHDSDMSQEDARQAVYFAEMLLIYLYKLPKMIRDRRSS